MQLSQEPFFFYYLPENQNWRANRPPTHAPTLTDWVQPRRKEKLWPSYLEFKVYEPALRNILLKNFGLKKKIIFLILMITSVAVLKKTRFQHTRRPTSKQTFTQKKKKIQEFFQEFWNLWSRFLVSKRDPDFKHLLFSNMRGKCKWNRGCCSAWINKKKQEFAGQ